MTVPEGERAAIQPGTARSESAQALTPNPVDGASPSAQLGNPSHATSIDGTQTTTRAGIVTGGEALATFSPRSAILPVFPRTDVSPSGASQEREALAPAATDLSLQEQQVGEAQTAIGTLSPYVDGGEPETVAHVTVTRIVPDPEKTAAEPPPHVAMNVPD